MGLIPQTFIDELIARTDIIEVIGSRVQLKKAGREYKACCPFHTEKTASFWVSPDKQFYHCFGCGAHGTVLRFLMDHDHLPFPEAIEELATRLGLEVPREGPTASAARRGDEPLYELMARVSKFYVDELARDGRAAGYVARRGLDAETCAKFGIGYAPGSWNEILKRFGGSDEARRALADVGLIIEKDGSGAREARAGDQRYYDRFRDRIMFPIRDSRGRVIAFGGRVLDQGEPKYLNSPETLLFHKGRELYALYEARRSSSNLRRLLIVEGYMDAVRLHQFGITCAIATLGTATTPEHLKRIFRIVPEVVFAFDGDRAGRAAAWRALQHALPEVRPGREIRFLFLPDGQDPDSLVGIEGAQGLTQRLDTAVSLSDYLLRELTEQCGELDKSGRARFARSAGPLIARMPEGVARELLIEQISRVVRLSPARLQEEWAREGTGRSRPPEGLALHAASPRSRLSAGRGGLVRQAIARVLTFPAIAANITSAEFAALLKSQEPGVELLRELIEHLQSQPALSCAQIIERWADRAGGEILQKILQAEQIVADRAAAEAEVHAALHKLEGLITVRRLEALEAKDAAVGLQPEEKQEYLVLITQRAGLQAPRS